MTFAKRVAPVLPLLVLAAGPLGAQGKEDPFAAYHAALLRATGFQLQLVGAPLSSSSPEAPPAGASNAPSQQESMLHRITPARLAAAREKLWALGVDAARVFVEEGVPEQLLVVAEVESAFNPRALSPKGARGLWQFMPETARRYGLRVDHHVDERLDVARSTRAAARYLRDLHLLFGDWQLALAAYNAGESRVAAAINQSGSRDFAETSTLLPVETRVYASRVLGFGLPALR